MPIYEFSCSKCGAEFEELVLGSKAEAISRIECPTCGSRSVKKKVSIFASGSKGSTSTSAQTASCAPSSGG